MRCHYEVLGIGQDASADDIKKAYRKCALQWHPDKNADNIDEAKRRFIEIQEAYETLLNDQDRAWYDAHREVLINGGKPGESTDAQEYLFNIYPYFSTTCFKGYGDDEKGFYSVYRTLFNKIAEEDKSSYDEDVIVPDFGDSNSNYEEVVGNFYAFWQSYCTPRSFVWVEAHDTREATDRYVRRLMEKENKKLKDKAKKERNEAIRKLVSFVRKRDKRVDEYKRILEEKAKEAQKKSEEKREADRRKRLEQMRAYVEPEWMKTTETKIDELNINDSDSDLKQQQNATNVSGDENSDEDEDSINDDFYCIACDKAFKSEKTFISHEKSKKHKENVELVKKHMKEDDVKLFFNETQKLNDENNDAEEKPQEEKSKSRLSKKQKKKKRQNAQNSSDSEDIYKESDTVITQTPDIEDEIEVAKPEAEPDSNLKKDTKKDVEVDSKPSICGICKEEFSSRNKLFDHIKESGHAMPLKGAKSTNKKSKSKKAQ